MKMVMKHVLVAMIAIVGCTNPASNVRALHSSEDRELTAGIVKREIRNGMSQSSVVEALGSPNIVTRDEDGKETWVYDKVATEASYSQSRGGAGMAGGVAGMAGSVLLLGIPAGYFEGASGATALSQRTLTVVIKFDESDRVMKSTYHSTRF